VGFARKTSFLWLLGVERFLGVGEIFMETFAYLHLAQDYEDPGLKEFVRSLEGGMACLAMPHTRPIALLSLPLFSLFCAAPSWVSPASAEVVYGGYPDSAIYLNTAAAYPSGYVTVRPNGDRVASSSTGSCTIVPNPCSGYRPVYPARPIYPVRPVTPPAADSGYLPIRPASSTFLRRGDTGESVRYVQDLLRSAGYFNAASTGFYATLTESGVKAFQRDQGLGVDGIVGTQTLAALEGQG
jgi:Putative peptidoglycan binding domain